MRKLLMIISLIIIGNSTVFAEDDFQLETVTVTAEKREADSQKISTPMIVMSETFVEDAGIDSISDIARYLPNISLYDNFGQNSTRIVFRGMEPNGFLETNPVILNIDGMTHDRAYGFSTTYEDIERIEVLRGPQGTLYGKNAMGGVINIITKKPDNTLRGRLSAGVEERNGYKGGFSLSGPIKKNLLYFGISGGYSQTDGFVDDKTDNGIKNLDEHKNKSLSLKLRTTPGKGNDILLKYTYIGGEGNAPPYSYTKEIKDEVYTGLDDYDGEMDSHAFLANMNFKRELFSLDSITTYYIYDNDEDFPVGISYGTPMMGVRDAKDTSFTQEIRVSSPEESKVKWLAGVFYDQGKQEKEEMSFYYGTMFSNWTPTARHKTYSAFTDVTIPFTSKASVTLGGRYEKMKRELDYEFVMTNSGVPMIPRSTYNTDGTWSAFLGKIAFSYQAKDNIRFYTSATQGYSPGGFNYTTAEKENAEFNEAKSVNYELGMKSKFFNNKLMFNANIFHTIYDDLQVMQVNRGITMEYSVGNAGKAHATGLEVDIAAKPARGLDLFMNFGITEAEYDDFKEANQQTGIVENFDGKKVVGAPDYQVTVGAKYRHSTGLFTMFDVKQTGQTYFDKENSSDLDVEPYAVANLKVGYESEKGFDVYAYVRNLMDEEYLTYREPKIGPDDYYDIRGESRTIGVELNYRF